MKMEQMMARLLAKIKAGIRINQAKTDANLRDMGADQELLKEEILAKMETDQEMMEAHHERMMAKDGLPATENGDLSGKDGGHRRYRVRVGASGSP
jgi:hypothetical protein